MSNTTEVVAWESEFAAVLEELSGVQTDLLATLAEKRHLLIAADGAGMEAIAAQEQSLLARLQHCQDRRLQLLSTAREEGHSADNLRELAQALPASQHRQLAPQLDLASRRARELRHHSLTNWVLAQQTLLHLSQLLEIIATAGRPKPTYGERGTEVAGGALLNQVG
ncbi:MAG: flagellar protein FlgN [Planctomycetota bacterium]|nr:flagellar protein FlgN [Planctomycetota bacterium]